MLMKVMVMIRCIVYKILQCSRDVYAFCVTLSLLLASSLPHSVLDLCACMRVPSVKFCLMNDVLCRQYWNDLVFFVTV